MISLRRVMPQLKVEQGIQAARTIFGKCFFNAEKCADGIQAIRHYRYESDDVHRDPSGKHVSLSKVPPHDWASHAADATFGSWLALESFGKDEDREQA